MGRKKKAGGSKSKSERMPEQTLGLDGDQIVVDLHTHLFNVRYLPLRGILGRWLGRSRFSRLMVDLVTRLLNEIAGSSYPSARVAPGTESTESLVQGENPDAAEEPQEDEAIDWLWSLVQERLEGEIRAVLSGAANPDSDSTLQKLSMAEDLQQSELVRVLAATERLREFSRGKTDSHLESLTSGQLPDFFELVEVQDPLPSVDQVLVGGNLIATAAVPSFEESFRWLFKKLSRWSRRNEKKAGVNRFLSEIGGLVAFLRAMVRSEKGIFLALKSSFRARDEDNFVFVHHMMDMELAYEPRRRPRYEFLTGQLPRMVHLARDAMTDGTLLIGFSAFDPRRTDWSIFEASLKLGFCGFKFYPPLGYRAWKNEDRNVQNRVREFFERCEASDIPIFTHCTPLGFQVKKYSGLNCNPEFWEMALKEFPKLRVCLAHGGNGRVRYPELPIPFESAGWYSNKKEWASSSNYSRRVVELCRTYQNVYCDLAHVTGLIDGKRKREAFVGNFTRAWNDTSGDCLFSEKCCFGSDSHMPGMILRNRELLDAYADLFAKEGLAAPSQFFHLNALRFLNLAGLAKRIENDGPVELQGEYLKMLRKKVST